jgi:hypothetical protein
MSNNPLEKQAERAENIADQTVDDALKETLHDAAKEYREHAKEEAGGEGEGYSLFDGETRIGRTFASEKEVWEAALIDGLVTDVPVADETGGQILPRDIASSAFEPNPSTAASRLARNSLVLQQLRDHRSR